MKELSIGIVGAGTAGLAASVFLARRGYRVRLFERVPELRPVGAGILLQPSGLAVLHELGLLDECTALGAPVSRLYGTSASSERERVILDTRYESWASGCFGLGIHRSVLMTSLMTAALKAGVSIEIGLTVSRFEQRPGHVRLFYQDTLEHESPLGDFAALVLADGTRSTLRRQMNVRQWVKPYPWGALWSVIPTPIGSDSTDLRQWYRRCAEMFGIMPTGSTHQARTTKLSSLFWSLPVASYDQWREEGVDGWRARVCALAGDAAQPFLQQVNNLEQLMMAVYADVRMQCWNDGRVLAIGDCAHAMSPQLGQGANMALVDASVLAQALEGAEPQEPNWPDVLSAYGELRRQHLRYYRQASRLLTPLFQSHSTPLAWLRDSALFLARHNAFGRKHAVTTLVCARTSWFFLSRQDRALYQWNGQQSETSLREDTKIDVS